MAAKVTTTTEFFDDITGEASDDVKMYSFGLDDTWYDIDLSDASAKKTIEKFRDAVLEHARVSENQDRATKPKVKRSGGKSSRTAAELADVREWAAQNGHVVNPKGRIPSAVWAAYDAA